MNGPLDPEYLIRFYTPEDIEMHVCNQSFYFFILAILFRFFRLRKHPVNKPEKENINFTCTF